MKKKLKNHPLRCLLILFTCLVFTGCSNDDSPEDQIRSFIKNTESAVEEKRIMDLREIIDDEYSDKGGRNKKELINFIVYQTLRQRSFHLLTTVDTIEFSTPSSAEVTVFVAMTGRPVESFSVLPDLQADLYRFHLLLKKVEGSWRFLSAEWHPAELKELFSE